MIRSRTALLLVLALGAACGGGSSSREDRNDQAPPSGSAAPGDVDAGSGEPLAKATVNLYFPSASAERLVAERREIIETPRPADRGAQILAALLEGPQSSEALPAVPEGTTLYRLWVRDDGTAYADFSGELAQGLAGSSQEILTLYAIVDSLAMNVPEIKRVAVLVNGRERETLGGHVDVRRPLPPEPDLVAQE